MSFRWNTELDNKLIDICKNDKETYATIAEKMLSTSYIVKQRMIKLNIKYDIKHGPQGKWTKEQQASLKKMISDGILTGREMGERLGKSTKEVYSKMGLWRVTYLSKNSGCHTWSQDEDNWLIENYSKKSQVESCEFLKKTRRQVLRRAKKLGLKLNPITRRIIYTTTRGIPCSFKGTKCRSMKELYFLILLSEKNIKWENAEDKFCIRYYVDGRYRNYRPDFIVDQIIYEIKTKGEWEVDIVRAKAEAAEEFCLANGLHYVMIDPRVDRELVKKYFLLGEIEIFGKAEQKFKNFINQNEPQIY